MKRAAIAAVVLSVTMAGMWLGILGLHRTGTALCDLANQLIVAVRAGERAESTQLFNELTARWSKTEQRLVPLIGRMHTDPVSVSLSRARVFLEQEQAVDLLAELSEWIAMIERMWRSEAFVWENFF